MTRPAWQAWLAWKVWQANQAWQAHQAWLAWLRLVTKHWALHQQHRLQSRQTRPSARLA